MSEEKPVTVGETAAWLSPRETLNIFRSAYDDSDSIKMLLLRLQSGAVRAIATSLFVPSSGKTRGTVLVTAKDWQRVEHTVPPEFWRTGDLRMLKRQSGQEYATEVIFLGVKFDPADVRALLPTREAPEAVDSEVPNKGKPLSVPLLRDWCDLYLKAYPEPERSEAHAARSVAGMFPGKSVSRDRLRAILKECGGARARGRSAI